MFEFCLPICRCFSNCIFKDSSFNTLASSSQRGARSYNQEDQDRLKHRLPLVQDQHQVRSLHCCIKTRNFNHLLLRLFLPLLFNFPLFSRPSSSIETSFTVHSYLNSTRLVGDQKTDFSLSVINAAGFPNQSLIKKSRPPTPDLYQYPLRLDNEMINHSTQNRRYHILRVSRMNSSLQNFTITRNRKLNRLTQTTTELKFEVTVKNIGLTPHPIPNST